MPGEDNREEGELSEEGELPDDSPPDEPQQQAGAADGARPQPGGPPPPPPQEQQQQQQAPQHGGPQGHQHHRAEQQPPPHVALARGAPPPRRDGDRRPEKHGPPRRGGGGGGGGAPLDYSERLREQERAQAAERERAELAQELSRLTHDLSFQEIRNNWTVACQDLRTAIKKLDKLLRRVKKRREDGVELYPPCHEFAGRIASGLKHVVVICSTGLGRLADMELANALMRTAVNYRHEVFSAAQKRELEQQIRDSREFRHLFTDSGRSSGTPGGGGGGGGASGGGGGGASGGDAGGRRDGEQQGEQQRPLQRGPQAPQAPHSGRSDGVQTSASKDDAVSEASHAAAGATSSRGHLGSSAAPAAAGAGEQPSPPGSVSAARSGGAGAPPGADGAAAAQGSQPDAAALSGRGGGSTAAAAAQQQQQQQQGRGHIRIVLNSTSFGGGAGASPAAAAAGPASTGSGGLKRGAPEIRDLEDDGQGEQEQAAKRARQQEHDSGGGGGGGAGGHANGVPLSELPEVAAALSNPSQLQVVLQGLLGGHRLCLVLDLDHTLVNSAKFSEVDADWEYKLEQLAAEQLSRPKESRDLHRLARVSMWTKLRPGVREFLARAARRFELWIYTAGSRAYAEAMVELLDPTRQYFGGRVIAQGPTLGAEESPADLLVVKRLMQGLEGREPVVMILDDSSGVWPRDRANLFVVERYIYFPSSRKRFGLQGKSLLEIDRDECPSRGMLMAALSTLERLHEVVFGRMRAAPPALTAESASLWDVRNVMAAEKRRVLAGVSLVFSRVIPLESDPRQHPLWQLAEQFGATCGEGCGDATTHVVATHGGTEKVMWAKQNNRHVVSPAWLECSCILWQRANEERFPAPY